MNPIDAKVNIKRFAVHLALNLLPLLFCLQVLLATTLARSYSFNSSSSVSVWSDESPAISTRSSTRGSLGLDFFIYALAGGVGRLAGRRGHSEIQHPSLPHRRHRFSFLRNAVSFSSTHFALFPTLSSRTALGHPFSGPTPPPRPDPQSPHLPMKPHPSRRPTFAAAEPPAPLRCSEGNRAAPLSFVVSPMAWST